MPENIAVEQVEAVVVVSDDVPVEEVVETIAENAPQDGVPT